MLASIRFTGGMSLDQLIPEHDDLEGRVSFRPSPLTVDFASKLRPSS